MTRATTIFVLLQEDHLYIYCVFNKGFFFMFTFCIMLKHFRSNTIYVCIKMRRFNTDNQRIVVEL